MADLPPCTATGCAAQHIPPGPDRDQVLVLLRLGARFRNQQIGKRPGYLFRLVLGCAERGGSPHTFRKLLDALELDAARRDLYGEQASPVEKVDRVWSLATIHIPKRGRVQVPFASLRRHLTNAKKILQRVNSRLPLNRENGSVDLKQPEVLRPKPRQQRTQK